MTIPAYPYVEGEQANQMLLQTNSYTVPRERRAEHARLMKRFKKSLARLGCDHFEVYEQVGTNWNNSKATGRFVQIMRFRDRAHYESIQESERTDINSQQLIQEFCELVDFEHQKDHGHYATGFYSSAIPSAATRAPNAIGRRGRDLAQAQEVEEEPVDGEAMELQAPSNGDEHWAADDAGEDGEADETASAEDLVVDEVEQAIDEEEPLVEEIVFASDGGEDVEKPADEEAEAEQPLIAYEPEPAKAVAPTTPPPAPQQPAAAPQAPQKPPQPQRPRVMMVENSGVQTISVAVGPRRGPLPRPLPAEPRPAQQQQPALMQQPAPMQQQQQPMFMHQPAPMQQQPMMMQRPAPAQQQQPMVMQQGGLASQQQTAPRQPPPQQQMPAAPAQMSMSGGAFVMNAPPTPRSQIVGQGPPPPQQQQQPNQPQPPQPPQQAPQPGTFVINSAGRR